MDDNCGIADVIKNARRGDERRASYLLEKYKSKRIKFVDEEDDEIFDGFCVRFR